MGRPSEISTGAARSKARSSTSPKTAPKSLRASPKSADRITKPPKKRSPTKKAKNDGRRLELVSSDGAVLDKVPVPNDFRMSLKELLYAGIHFRKPESPTELAPIPYDGLPEPQGMKRGPTAFCYRLGLLQALAHAPAFCIALRASRKFCKSKGSKDKCLACALYFVIRSYWYDPERINDAVQNFNKVVHITTTPSPWFFPDADEQADIQEFFLWLSAAIKAQHPTDAELQAAFNIALEGRWICDHCAKVHVNTESDICISVGITTPKEGMDLRCYLYPYTNEDLVIRCDGPKCNSNESRERSKRFTALPNTLFVHLKLFEFTGRKVKKVTSKVRFPEVLSLKEFAEDGVEGTKYELTAYVAHKGSINEGHYVAVVKGPQGISEINDHRRAKKKGWLDVSQVFVPYLLVYERLQAP